jgi:hypothetical protein
MLDNTKLKKKTKKKEKEKKHPASNHNLFPPFLWCRHIGTHP